MPERESQARQSDKTGAMTLDPKELGGVVAGNAADAEVWIAHGLECAMLRSPVRGKNGYVRMPEPFRSRKLHYDDISYEEVEVHAGLTYGMDDGGWVGFDTCHAWDQWLPDSPDEPEGSLELARRELDLAPAPLSEFDVVWTTEKLRGEVESLAKQLVDWCKRHPDFEGEMSAEERIEQSRQRLRKWDEDES